MSKKNILVTGATGFIGSFIVKELAKKGENVTFLYKDGSNKKVLEEYKKLGIKSVVGDVRVKSSLLKAITNVEVIIHCAAVHDVSKKELIETNVDGTKNLIDVCIEKGVKRFIHISSATVYGKIENGNEDSKCLPETDYAESKYLTDLLLKNYIDKINLTILRPPIVYGNHPRATLVKWLKHIYKGRFLIFGNGNNHIEVVHIKDLVNIILLILDKKVSYGKIYNISSPTTTMNDFTSLIAKIEGVNRPRHVPIWLAKIAAFKLTILFKILNKKSPLTLTNVKNMIRDRSISYERARKELGYEAKVNREKAIKEMVSWCKSNAYF